MFYKPLLLPLLAMIALTFVVWLTMYITRISEMQRKKIDPQKLHGRVQGQKLLTDSAAAAENLKNLFEMPVLFYTAVLLSLVLLLQDPLLVSLAWGFVLMRTVHSVVHCSYNRVMHRFIAYVASCAFLLLMWLRLGAYILSS